MNSSQGSRGSLCLKLWCLRMNNDPFSSSDVAVFLHLATRPRGDMYYSQNTLLHREDGPVLKVQAHCPIGIHWEGLTPPGNRCRFGGFPKMGGTPKSSSLMGYSLINHPFGGTPTDGNHHLVPWCLERIPVESSLAGGITWDGDFAWLSSKAGVWILVVWSWVDMVKLHLFFDLHIIIATYIYIHT